VLRPNRKGNIITVYAIQRDIERSEIDDVHRNNIDTVLVPCWVAASVEFMERAGYPPISPDISPTIRSRLSGIGRSWTAVNPLTSEAPNRGSHCGSGPFPSWGESGDHAQITGPTHAIN
jgi:hypothetical protein